MTQTTLALLAATAALALGGRAAARSDDDGKETVETRLLRILRDRGVLSDKEFDELAALGARMRADEAMTSATLDRELRALTEKLSLQAEKKTDSGPALSYKFGKGITVKQGDDFSMTIGGRFQPRFTYISPDGPTEESATIKNDDRATFEVRRARINFEGNVLGKDTTYKVQFDVAASTGTLRDAYIDHRFADEIHVRAGQMKRPFARQNFTSSGSLEFVDRSAVNDRFRSVNGGDRTNGLFLWGELEEKSIEWYAGAFNGEGLNNGNSNPPDLGGSTAGGSFLPANASNDDTGLEAVARLAYNPFGPIGYSEVDLDRTPDPKLGFGLNYMYTPERRGNPLGLAGNDIPAGQLPQYDVHTWGGDIAFRYLGLFATAEAFYREITATGNLGDTPGHFLSASETGWYVQGGYFFGSDTKHAGPEVAARYSQIDFDQSIAPAQTALTTQKVDDYTVAFSYYFEGHALKLQSDYTYRVRDLKGTAVDDQDQIFRIQAQIMF
jgi:phosphate-selective porin OprO and OprP